jgi:hypothetical protein
MYGTTLMAHLGAMMGFWAVFVWDARGATTPSIWLGSAATDVSMTTNKAIAAGSKSFYLIIFMNWYIKWSFHAMSL